ncbi:PQQ-like beta-propeller repeat protein [Candidatus Sumerlaeota bacterium]|nr:PQQ-like beta-propeller repeat protein [Candidatus Sumerlaeota bacterium]
MRVRSVAPWLAIAVVVALCGIVFWTWISMRNRTGVPRRVPVEHPAASAGEDQPPENPGTLTLGSAKPSTHPGEWSNFRGANHDNIATSSVSLARSWPPEGPPVLWRIPVGEGHAAAAIRDGRVYLIDYDREKQEDAIRCLSLDTGEEIWRYSYSVLVKRNHGMSRTIPTLNGRFVVTIGPKCHVVCLDALSGELAWKKDLVREHETKVPMWYAGQCPLIDNGRAILAPGEKPLMMAVDPATGETVWQTQELDGWGMTYSSILPIEFQGERQYVYCSLQGVASVSARDGRVLWTLPEWKTKIATIAMPVWIAPDRLFFSGGYNIGSMMVRLEKNDDGETSPTVLFRLESEVYGADQNTPILYRDHLYGVAPKPVTALVCLDLEGNRLWTSVPHATFGLGPFLIVNDLILALDDEKGTLHLAEATATGYRELAQAKLLNGHDAWGPLAFAEGRLILRDLTEMICVDLEAK